jgi:DNA polymerase III epsilon subunit-like protein
MYVFFDTETTGLPQDFNAPATDLDNWPRVIQLAWQLYDEDENLIRERSELIKPDGWSIPEDSDFHKEHGYTNERLEAEGVELKPLLEELVKDLAQSEYLVAHNMSFDEKVVSAELIRYSVPLKNKPKKVCTMKESTSFCKLMPFRYGTYKWPTLLELHKKLFDEEFDGAHDALADVKACARSFFELRNKEVILKS